jgi:osmotically-inducible protein OsmY
MLLSMSGHNDPLEPLMTKNWFRSASRTFALVAASAVLGIASLAQQARSDTMPDAWITTKVKLALITTEGVSANDVNVDTVDGRVTLHGTVATAAEKSAAEDAARTIKGTRDVRNLLQVVKASAHPAMKVADAQLKDQVSAALARDAALTTSKIEVASVNKGVVLLSGTAITLSDTLRAVEIASRVDGVSRVASEIQSPDVVGDAEVWRSGKYDAATAAGSTAQDMWTTSDVKMRLLANSTTPGFDINVDTDNGVVTLFGVVDSKAAKDAAGAEVRKVDGVKGLVNELQVVAPSKQNLGAANDESIDTAVTKRLDANERLKGSAIDIDVKNGVVHLTGTVDSQSDRITALTVTRSTMGVRGLVDDLKITPAVSAN